MLSPFSKVDANYTYLKYLPLIEKFIDYFLQKAAPLIYQAEKQKLILPMEQELFLTPEVPSLYLEESVEKFLDEISEVNLFVKSTSGVPMALSKRESDCLLQLRKGLTIKQIADHLKISPRTVESHVSKIKTKTGYFSKSSLCAAISNEMIYYDKSQGRR